METKNEDHNATIKKLLETSKMSIGRDLVLKGLKNGKIKKVYMAKNTDADTKKDLEHYAKLGGIELIKLPLANDELGVICKKPFNISVLGQK